MNPRNVPSAVAIASTLVLAAAPAFAQPSPATSVVPSFINVTGFQAAFGDVPDVIGAFTVVVNDAAGAPIVGAEVVLDFTDCNDMCLCTYAIPGVTVACNPADCRGTVSAITGAGGVAAFRVLGAGQIGVAVPPAVWPGPALGCIAVSAGPPGGPFAALGRSTAVLLDINGANPGGGSNGMNGLDLSFTKNDLGVALLLGTVYRGRSDYSGDGVLNGVDLSVWRVHFLRAANGTGSAGGCSSAGVIDYCP